MRGIVLDIKGDRCIVMKKGGSFEEIRNQNYEIGQEIRFSSPAYTKYLSAAACLILVCTAILGYHLYFTPVSFVYLDINPSIRLELNRFERVIDVVPLNDDANDLLSFVTVSKKNAQDCINDIVSACQEQHYINEQNTDIDVSICTDDSKLESDVETVSADIEKKELYVSVTQIDEEENQSAMEHHISAKRLRAVKAYTEAFGSTLEENLKALRNISNDEIYMMLKRSHNELYEEDTRSAKQKVKSSSKAADNFSGTDDTHKNDQRSEGVKEPSNTSDHLQDTSDNSSDTDSISANGHKLTAKRLAAIRAYTDQFGGTLEENAALLQGVSSSDIYQMINEAVGSDHKNDDVS